MVSKKTIGKIQFIIGIIILVIGILGLVYSIEKYLDLNETLNSASLSEQQKESMENVSEEFKALINLNSANIKISSISLKYSLVFPLMSTSIILIILSLIFITQGLLNKSGNQNAQ